MKIVEKTKHPSKQIYVGYAKKSQTLGMCMLCLFCTSAHQNYQKTHLFSMEINFIRLEYL